VNFWFRLPSLPSRNVVLVAAQNDAMAQGAKDAFNDAYDSRRWSNLIFTGCDATPQKGERLVRGRGLSATVLRPPTAGIAVEVLVQTLREGIIPAQRTLVTTNSYPNIEELGAGRKRKMAQPDMSYQFTSSPW
jgi:hypothetical protein